MSGAIDFAEEIRRIQRDHYHDGDGGYAAVEAIRALWRTLEPPSQQTFRDTLTEFVVRREPGIWSLAWETLVQENARDIAPEMLQMLCADQFDAEWTDEIVLGLLRLGYRGGLDYFRTYVKKRLVEAGLLVLPLVAALARVSPEDSVALAAECIVRATQGGLEQRVEKYVATFVRHYIAVDENLLRQLVVALKMRDAKIAKAFTVTLNAYLAKPWMLKELGDQRSANIRAGLTAAAGIEN